MKRGSGALRARVIFTVLVIAFPSQLIAALVTVHQSFHRPYIFAGGHFFSLLFRQLTGLFRFFVHSTFFLHCLFACRIVDHVIESASITVLCNFRLLLYMLLCIDPYSFYNHRTISGRCSHMYPNPVVRLFTLGTGSARDFLQILF